jgi:hypothetical protein
LAEGGKEGFRVFLGIFHLGGIGAEDVFAVAHGEGADGAAGENGETDGGGGILPGGGGGEMPMEEIKEHRLARFRVGGGVGERAGEDAVPSAVQPLQGAKAGNKVLHGEGSAPRKAEERLLLFPKRALPEEQGKALLPQGEDGILLLGGGAFLLAVLPDGDEGEGQGGLPKEAASLLAAHPQPHLGAAGEQMSISGMLVADGGEGILPKMEDQIAKPVLAEHGAAIPLPKAKRARIEVHRPF